MNGVRRRLVAAFAVLAVAFAGQAAYAQAGRASLAGGADNAVSNMQSSLMNDPASRDQVLSLQADPDVQAILDDPATMRAIQAGDLSVLMSNPKLQALSKNPAVRALVEQQGH